MKKIFTIFTLFISQLVFGQASLVKHQKHDTKKSIKNISLQIDSIFNEAYPPESPGASVLISKGDKIIHRKAYGMADLESKVEMKPENILHIASITKQFTSVGILMLVESGKLNLQDPIKKFIADFPRGNEITIHHLLNHTSGIKSYTNLPEFREKTRLDLNPEEIINYFKYLELDFNPGDKYEYSNSGYVLLGYIIEKISGMSYEEYIQKHIFNKIGMKNSCYSNHYKIIPNRAKGYQIYEGNYENAEFMSSTIAYSAGSLMSTIDDMFLWNKAIKNNTLISENTKKLAFTDYILNNAEHNHYGYGWAINEIAGLKTLEHTGGINGFTTSGIYIPEEDIYAIVLSNLDDGKGPELLNIKAVSIVLGKAIVSNKTPINLNEMQLNKWLGAYQFNDVTRFIINENGTLYSQRKGGRPFKLIPLNQNEYLFEGQLATYKFSIEDGKRKVIYSDRIKKSVGYENK